MKWFLITLITLGLSLTQTACKNEAPTDKTSSSSTPTPSTTTNKRSNPLAYTGEKKVIKKGNIANPANYVPYHDSDVVEFKSKMGKSNTILVDIRTPAEFKKRSLDGAINVNVLDGLFPKEIGKFDKDKIFLLYGATGMRSKKAARTMAEMGFKNVYSLSGGLAAFDRVEKELEKK